MFQICDVLFFDLDFLFAKFAICFISLIVWLKFAYHASCWVPYKNIIWNSLTCIIFMYFFKKCIESLANKQKDIYYFEISALKPTKIFPALEMSNGLFTRFPSLTNSSIASSLFITFSEAKFIMYYLLINIK